MIQTDNKPVYEPFALLDMWLNATHPDNADWDSEKLIEVILTEYGDNQNYQTVWPEPSRN